MRDQAERLRQIVKGNRDNRKSPIIKHDVTKARVITITSGKGGVGKTNLTVNLALALAGFGQKVLVIDADLGTANVDVVLGCPAHYSLLNLLEDGLSIADILTDGPRGIKFMSGGSGIYRMADLTTAQLHNIISQITLLDNWANIILIDTGAGINRNVLNFVMAADEVIIITTPEPTAITDAYAMMKAYAGYNGTAPLNVVVNRIMEMEEGQLVVEKLNKVSSRFLGLTINNLGYVYEDRNVGKAIKNQTPLLLSYPDSISAQCIEHIARRMLYGSNTTYSRGIKGFFNKFFEMW